MGKLWSILIIAIFCSFLLNCKSPQMSPSVSLEKKTRLQADKARKIAEKYFDAWKTGSLEKWAEVDLSLNRRLQEYPQQLQEEIRKELLMKEEKYVEIEKILQEYEPIYRSAHFEILEVRPFYVGEEKNAFYIFYSIEYSAPDKSIGTIKKEYNKAEVIDNGFRYLERQKFETW